MFIQDLPGPSAVDSYYYIPSANQSAIMDAEVDPPGIPNITASSSLRWRCHLSSFVSGAGIHLLSDAGLRDSGRKLLG
jgi:hypothetical protein